MAEPLQKRPVLNLPLSPLEKIAEVIAGGGVLFTIFILLQAWPTLPESVPRHFNASGEADGWGGKGSLLILPAIGFVIYVSLTVLNRFPHIFNYPFALTEENVERQYRCARLLISALKAQMVWLFAYIEWQTIQTALGKAEGLGPMFMPVLLIFSTGTIVVYFYQASRIR